MTSVEFEAAVHKLTAVVGELQAAYHHVEQERERLEDECADLRSQLATADKCITNRCRLESKSFAQYVAEALRDLYALQGGVFHFTQPVPTNQGGYYGDERDQRLGHGAGGPHAAHHSVPG